MGASTTSSHPYGCSCEAPCDVCEPCPTASIEWNSVRARFAHAYAIESWWEKSGGCFTVSLEMGHGDPIGVRLSGFVGVD